MKIWLLLFKKIAFCEKRSLGDSVFESSQSYQVLRIASSTIQWQFFPIKFLIKANLHTTQVPQHPKEGIFLKVHKYRAEPNLYQDKSTIRQVIVSIKSIFILD